MTSQFSRRTFLKSAGIGALGAMAAGSLSACGNGVKAGMGKSDPSDDPKAQNWFWFGEQPFLKINLLGKRFCNESGPYDYMLHSAWQQPYHTMANNGKDEDYNKEKARMIALDQPPYYGVRTGRGSWRRWTVSYRHEHAPRSRGRKPHRRPVHDR